MARRNDAEAVRQIYAPFVVEAATSFEYELPSREEMENRIQDLLDHEYPWLVFEENGEVRGYAYAGSHRSRKAYQWSVEPSVYIHPQAHHRGVGRALYRALFAILREQGYVNAYAGITMPNAASVGLHESMGFSLIGVFPNIGFKFGRWHDVSWWYLRLLDPETVDSPRSLAHVRDVVESVMEQEALTIR